MEPDADAGRSVPALVPARMLNEFTYCRRLFYLEWVQQQFAVNEEVAEGVFGHRRVDRGGGQAPVSGVTETGLTARSVTLSSDRIGLIASIDVLEQEGGEVVPVDFKRGRPPDLSEHAWEPERVQLCAQMLLLRDNGYRCERGEMYFLGSRQRVVVEFTDELEARTIELLAGLRATAAAERLPPPLVDSPKCPRCSLVGICLPDEVNVLRGIQSPPLRRRIVPSASAARPLYVREQGAVLGKKGGRIEIRRGTDLIASVRLLDVSQVCVFGGIQVTTGLLRECFRREIPVCFFSHGGWLSGVAEGVDSKNVDLRLRQTAAAMKASTEYARRMVEAKIRNGRTLLRRNARGLPTAALAELAELAQKASQAETHSTLLGIEGAAGRTYFANFPRMIKREAELPGQAFSFEGRNRRPPRDAVNCLLSYAYALLVKDLLVATRAVGFDPYLGVYHRPRYGRPALALDLAEEFRPIVAESVVVGMINNGEVRPSDFVVRAHGVALTERGRKAMLAAYERRMEAEIKHPLFGYSVTYRRALEMQCRILASAMLGELDSYRPLTTR